MFSVACAGADGAGEAGEVTADVAFCGDGDCSIFSGATVWVDSTIRTAFAAGFGAAGLSGAAEA